jgi:hypothetical protein
MTLLVLSFSLLSCLFKQIESVEYLFRSCCYEGARLFGQAAAVEYMFRSCCYEGALLCLFGQVAAVEYLFRSCCYEGESLSLVGQVAAVTLVADLVTLMYSSTLASYAEIAPL